MLSRENSSFLKKHLIIITWLLTVCYGISDEIHQAFVPTRQMSLWDLLADALGATAVILMIAFRDYEP